MAMFQHRQRKCAECFSHKYENPYTLLFLAILHTDTLLSCQYEYLPEQACRLGCGHIADRTSGTSPGGVNVVPKATTMLDMKLHRRVGDMCNLIHAIFRRSNFKNISDDSYDALRPSLRLATRLLTTHELAGFPHAILVAPYKYITHEENADLDEWERSSFQRKGGEDYKLTDRDMALYNLALLQIADCVQFSADDKEDISCGYCNGKEQHDSETTHLKKGSTIYFSKKDVEAHVSLRSLPPDDHRVLQRTFLTAVILMYELMHAFAFARLGDLEFIPFESSRVVETGYEWEIHTLGGIMSTFHLSPFGFHTDLTVRDWPSAATTRYYQHKNYNITVLEDPLSVEIWWMVPVEGDFFRRIFTTDFWETAIPAEGKKALRASRVRGCRTKIAKDGAVSLVDPSREFNPSYDQVVPDGYVVDVDGEVVIDLSDDQDSEMP